MLIFSKEGQSGGQGLWVNILVPAERSSYRENLFDNLKTQAFSFGLKTKWLYLKFVFTDEQGASYIIFFTWGGGGSVLLSWTKMRNISQKIYMYLNMRL